MANTLEFQHTDEQRLNLPDAPAQDQLRIVFLGDIVGRPGMRVATKSVKWLRKKLFASVVLANAENAADGSGLTVNQYKRLVTAGFDGITLGDHVYRKREIMPILDSESNIVRPANFPSNSAGNGYCLIESSSGATVAVISLLGRTFTKPVDCPFACVDRLLDEIPEPCKIRFVDMHCETTSDAQSMGHHLDGRVSAMLGTHTHVATADEQIFPGGTAFQCDVGMTGPMHSIIGRKIEPVLETTRTLEPNSFHVATEDVRIGGTWFDVGLADGKATRIERLSWPESMIEAWESSEPNLAHNM
jgi:metallophosphoesterase (TIGR00282 family)